MPTWKILEGDARARLAELPDGSVHCVVTSPPYWGLRDYGTATWEGGDPDCDHKRTGRTQNLDKLGERLGSGGGHSTSDNVLEPYMGDCGKCGAVRVDAQLGLEPTPEEYVAAIVDVFREVRRVLRDDGTLWLNLGDSYAGSGPANNDGFQERWNGRRAPKKAATDAVSRATPTGGLKPKDLVGIPWRVARALQEPYYTGEITSEGDRIWLAAMIDGEGCIFLHKRKAGQSNGQGYHRKHDSYGAGLEVANTSRAIVERCLVITGKGSICHQDKGRRQRLYRWNLRSNECRGVLAEVYPYLVAKQHEARLAIGCPSSGTKAAAAHEGLKALHNGRDAGIDFAAPASLYKPGWYLRSDIIWSKSNPMPESVTDRPTKAHEYLFLLTKSARYYYDGDAIKEPMQCPADSTPEDLRRAHNSRRAQAPEKRQGRIPSGWDQTGGNHRGKRGRYTHDPPSESGAIANTAPGRRNKRTVWTIPTHPFPGVHFATFPTALVEPCVKAGTSERGACADCGAPWKRIVERGEPERIGGDAGVSTSHAEGPMDRGGRSQWDEGHMPTVRPSTTVGWEPTCGCDSDPDLLGEGPRREVPCVVLDPFAGAGTTLVVSTDHGRDAVGIELNPEYAALARERLRERNPLFAREAT